MARTSGAPGERGGATMFLVDAGNPGMRVVRDIDTLDEGLFGGHSEVVFDGCVVGPESVLGEVDRGFEYAQVRLAPGPADALHAVAGAGAAGARHRGRLGRDPQVVRRPARRPRHGPAACGRLRDRHGGEPGAHLAHRRRPGQRRQRRDRILHRQDVRGRGGQPGGRPRRCRSAARSASPATSCSPATCARYARSGSTTGRPRCTAGRSAGGRSASAGAPSRAASSRAGGARRRRPS